MLAHEQNPLERTKTRLLTTLGFSPFGMVVFGSFSSFRMVFCSCADTLLILLLNYFKYSFYVITVCYHGVVFLVILAMKCPDMAPRKFSRIVPGMVPEE